MRPDVASTLNAILLGLVCDLSACAVEWSEDCGMIRNWTNLGIYRAKRFSVLNCALCWLSWQVHARGCGLVNTTHARTHTRALETKGSERPSRVYPNCLGPSRFAATRAESAAQAVFV